MRTLLLDMGNSSAAFCIYNPATGAFSDVGKQYYPADITVSFFTGLWHKKDKPEQVIVSSVSSVTSWQALQSACHTLWGIEPDRVISAKEACGVINAYPDEASLGSDRWCAMIAAFDEFKSDLMVVDCGTALTIDIVTADKSSGIGHHRGGYILPGLSMMKKSLGMNTAAISVDEALEVVSTEPANTTAAGIDAAVSLAGAALIETVFRQQLEKYNDLQCIITGGDAPRLAPSLPIQYISRPDLVLHGLACFANKNDK